VKHTGRELEGGSLGLAKGKLTLSRMHAAQRTNPNLAGVRQHQPSPLLSRIGLGT
jgi:hypothetical protein